MAELQEKGIRPASSKSPLATEKKGDPIPNDNPRVGGEEGVAPIFLDESKTKRASLSCATAGMHLWGRRNEGSLATRRWMTWKTRASYPLIKDLEKGTHPLNVVQTLTPPKEQDRCNLSKAGKDRPAGGGGI